MSACLLNAPAPAARQERRLVDAPIRMFHALFALCLIGAYLSADSERWRLPHITLGYTLGGLLAFRVIYGLIGPRQARLGVLTRKLAGGWQALRAPGRAAPPALWRQAQNLLLALTIALLLALAPPLVLSGWAAHDDWGGAFEALHAWLGNAMPALALGHAGLVALLSLLRRKNLALPMLTGRAGGAGAVVDNRAWLAALMLLAALAFGGWMFTPSDATAQESTEHKHPRHHDHPNRHDR